MDYFAGLDVSLEAVNVCIVDRDGSVLLKQKVGAEPQEIVAFLKEFGRPLKRVGLEAGPTSSWLFTELRAAGFPALCLECRHVKAGLSAMRNKTDRNDARGIAYLVRLGWFRGCAREERGSAANPHAARQSQSPALQVAGYRELSAWLAQSLWVAVGPSDQALLRGQGHRARRGARQYCCDYRAFAAGAPCAPG